MLGSSPASSNGTGKADQIFSSEGPHVFFSPHADDVVLSCGGTIHSLIAQNKTVRVVSVFAGIPNSNGYSAYARHLHSKWGLQQDPIAQRWVEDDLAMKELGITSCQRWDYFEAPYRVGSDGVPLYLGNEELVGSVSVQDQTMRGRIAERVQTLLNEMPPSSVLYFPLSLGKHVDHQILFHLGVELANSGRQVRFYEDYPYARLYTVDSAQRKWSAQDVPILLDRKLSAACAYKSQLRGLGGTPEVLQQRLREFGTSLGRADVSERYWKIAVNGSKSSESTTQPFVPKKAQLQLRDFGKFLKTFRWHDLDEILPPGDGTCLDVGCGTSRHQKVVENRGYNWVGVDRGGAATVALRADAASLPFSDHCASGVVAWQVLEYVEQPELFFAEAARVIEPGGVFCGSVSFLEPVHGHTYFNFSPLILERLLSRHGFSDIAIKPGLNGMALLLWTWLRRCGMPSLARLALPLTSLAFAPFAALMFLLSWFWARVGGGSGHTMQWLTQTAPLEFAGHLMFVARKTARTRPATESL